MQIVGVRVKGISSAVYLGVCDVSPFFSVFFFRLLLLKTSGGYLVILVCCIRPWKNENFLISQKF